MSSLVWLISSNGTNVYCISLFLSLSLLMLFMFRLLSLICVCIYECMLIRIQREREWYVLDMTVRLCVLCVVSVAHLTYAKLLLLWSSNSSTRMSCSLSVFFSLSQALKMIISSKTIKHTCIEQKATFLLATNWAYFSKLSMNVYDEHRLVNHQQLLLIAICIRNDFLSSLHPLIPSLSYFSCSVVRRERERERMTFDVWLQVWSLRETVDACFSRQKQIVLCFDQRRKNCYDCTHQGVILVWQNETQQKPWKE